MQQPIALMLGYKKPDTSSETHRHRSVSSFIYHIEKHLGPIRSGARLGEGISAVRFTDCPMPGATTFMTLGLSHHFFSQAVRESVCIELLVACREDLVEPFNPASVLADVCERIVPAHVAPPRGTVFGPAGRFFAASKTEALYCSPPAYFHEDLGKFDGFSAPFVPIWLVPITPAEAAFVGQRGWQAFEDLLDEKEPDLLDLTRPCLILDDV